MSAGKALYHRWLVAVACLFAGMPGFAQQDFSKVEVKTIPVADGVYMLMGAGGNIGLSIGKDGVLLIDDQYAPLTDRILAAIGEITDQPVRMILNTHWHGDHTGGNENLAGEGALIIAHDNVRTRMSARHFSAFFKSETPASPELALPVVTFSETVTLHLNGQTIRAEHMPPAHTDGDSIIWFDGLNVVHMGDIFFNEWYPFIDFDSGGSVTGMIDNVNQVLPQLDEHSKVIPGHGPLSDKAGLVRFRDMLETVSGRVQKMIDDGMSTDEIVAAQPSQEYDEVWGDGFLKPEQWIRMLCYGMGCQ